MALPSPWMMAWEHILAVSNCTQGWQSHRGRRESRTAPCASAGANPGIPEGVAGPAEQGEDLGPWFMAVLLAVLG